MNEIKVCFLLESLLSTSYWQVFLLLWEKFWESFCINKRLNTVLILTQERVETSKSSSVNGERKQLNSNLTLLRFPTQFWNNFFVRLISNQENNSIIINTKLLSQYLNMPLNKDPIFRLPSWKVNLWGSSFALLTVTFIRN